MANKPRKAPEFRWAPQKLGHHLKLEQTTYAHVWPASGQWWWSPVDATKKNEVPEIKGPFRTEDEALQAAVAHVRRYLGL